MQLSILVDYLKVLIEKICQINYMKMFQTKQLKIFSIHSIYLFKEALIIKSFSRGLKNTHQIWKENKKLAKTGKNLGDFMKLSKTMMSWNQGAIF